VKFQNALDVMDYYFTLVAIPNWCGEKCVTKASQNLKHKTWLVSQYNIPLWQ
jgi:hypothetical protein